MILLISRIRGFHLKPKIKQIFCVSEAKKSYSLLFSLGFGICVILAGIITSHAGFGRGMGNEC